MDKHGRRPIGAACVGKKIEHAIWTGASAQKTTSSEFGEAKKHLRTVVEI